MGSNPTSISKKEKERLHGSLGAARVMALWLAGGFGGLCLWPKALRYFFLNKNFRELKKMTKTFI